MHVVAAILVPAIFGWVVWCIASPQADVVIRWKARNVRVRGPFPEGKRRALLEFLRNEFADCSRLTIRGIRDCSGGMRWKISGRIAPGDDQRIRNFLRLA